MQKGWLPWPQLPELSGWAAGSSQHVQRNLKIAHLSARTSTPGQHVQRNLKIT
jgi:hypothetical protein